MNNEDVKKEMNSNYIPLTTRSYDGKYYYANTEHPYWKTQTGNPYLPLDENGNLRKGYVG